MVISRKSLTIFGLALSAALFANGCSSKKPNKSAVVASGTGDVEGEIPEVDSPPDEPTSKKPGKIE